MGMIKTQKELRLLKKSATISNSCIPLIKSSLKENISERELARRIRRRINSQGATLSFQTLVASGKRTAMIHPKPHATDQKINGIGYVDFGACYKGYHSDVTVPFVKGSVGKKEWRIIKTGLAAYNLAVKSTRLEKSCWLVHKEADQFLKKNGFRLLHGLGHGLGKKIHERPIIGMPSKKLKGKRLKRWRKIQKVTFKPNMIFTIEPGIYVRNLGGFRIENDFLMTSKGPKVFTNSRFLKSR
jgi:Xaa-Pro aminopeptidase